jgi:shikimate dehydrogenase
MRIFGLIGYPLSHSFSKKYFTDKFLSEGITGCRYDLFPMEDIALLPALIAAHPRLEGLNVTIPYKEKVISFLDDSSGVVKAINACNCITIRKGKTFWP